MNNNRKLFCKHIGFYVTPKMMDQLNEMLIFENTNLSEFMRQLIREKYEEHSTPKKKSKNDTIWEKY